MIYLDANSQNILTAKSLYTSACKDFVHKRYSNAKSNKKYKISKKKYNVTNEQITLFDKKIIPFLDKILFGLPAEICKLSEEICNSCTSIEQADILIRYIFDYDALMTKNNKNISYELAKNLDIRVCPYCNRNFINTVVNEKGRKICRPNFDHYFDRDHHPILALSFHNLIPSCSTCNSSIKGTKVLSIEEYAHPYIDKGLRYISFDYDLTGNQLSPYKVKVNCDPNSAIGKYIKVFEIEEVYKSHIEDLSDLIKLRNYFSDRYIEILKSNILAGLPVPEEDIYRIVFGIEHDYENFHKKPLSKFKHDILEKLGIILPKSSTSSPS